MGMLVKCKCRQTEHRVQADQGPHSWKQGTSTTHMSEGYNNPQSFDHRNNPVDICPAAQNIRLYMCPGTGLPTKLPTNCMISAHTYTSEYFEHLLCWWLLGLETWMPTLPEWAQAALWPCGSLATWISHLPAYWLVCGGSIFLNDTLQNNSTLMLLLENTF